MRQNLIHKNPVYENRTKERRQRKLECNVFVTYACLKNMEDRR